MGSNQLFLFSLENKKNNINIINQPDKIAYLIILYTFDE